MGLFRKKKVKPEIEEPPAYQPSSIEDMKNLDLGPIGNEGVGIKKPALTKDIKEATESQLNTMPLLKESTPTEMPGLGIPEHEPEVPEVKGPLFIKIDKYKVALESVESINKKLSDITKALDKLKELKDKETAEIDKWEGEVEDMKRKLANVEKSLFSKLG